VDLIGGEKKGSIYLFETKTKGDVNEELMRRQLASGFDLQTMFYLVALTEGKRLWPGAEKQKRWPVAGVRYNVVRRPLSGGKGSIRQHKPTKANPQGEPSGEFYARLGGIIADEPGYFFMRWKIEVTEGDILRFRRECLDPILEQLCDWWEWVSRPTCEEGTDHWDHESGLHWRFPYGIFSAIMTGGSDDLDEYMLSGSTLGLEKAEILFRELE